MTSSHAWHPEYGAWSSKDRLRAVELKLWGVSAAEVAQLYHVTPCTIRVWVRAWQAHNPPNDPGNYTHPNLTELAELVTYGSKQPR